MWGKNQCLLDSENERMGGPLAKKVRVPSPKQGNEVEEQREWWERVVDALKVANTKQQVAHTQFKGLSWAVEYITEAVYHDFVVSREGSGEEQEGIMVPER